MSIMFIVMNIHLSPEEKQELEVRHNYNGLKKSDNKKVFLFPKRCKNKI